MCGLCGVAEVGGGVDRSLIQRMGDSMVHRGPDQGGVYTWSEGALGVGLATRRLAILDLSPAGSQPMATGDGLMTLAYNGEIYNEPGLRRDLEGRGYAFRSTSDTETVLYAYQEYGTEALARLNGMFALAIHDRRRGELVLARDRMGIKPLYYRWDGKRLLFGSELRTLIQQAGVPPSIDPDALDAYLACGYVPSPYSLIRGVRKLPPGSYLILDGEGRLTIRQFWQMAYPAAARIGRSEATQAVHDVLHGAVRRQMRSDVPVGVLLSGGVDSTIVAVSAAAQTDQALNTFSIAFADESSPVDQALYNVDASYARRVADVIGARHHEVQTDEHEVGNLLRALVVGLDEPVWELSFVSIFLMSRLARQHGVKVLLTGDGSDELFAGYPWVAAAWRQEQYERLPFLRQLLPLAARVLPAGSVPAAHVRDLQAILSQSDAARYEWTHAIFKRNERRALLAGHDRPADADSLDGLLTPILAGAAGRARPDRAAMLDLALWVRDHFNQRVDRMTMLNSVEARVPFQDNEVVDLGLRLSFWQKAPFARPKRLLREAFASEIPSFVLERPKRPFAAPQWAWGKGALKPLVHEVLDEANVRAAGLVEPARARRVLIATATARQDASTFKLWTLVTLHLWAAGLGVSGSGASCQDAPSLLSAVPR